jgi:hypothetical protein
LLRANAEFYDGANAPDFVIVKVNPVDHRLPMSEDAAALFVLMDRYRPAQFEKGYLLLKKHDVITRAPFAGGSQVESRTITLNEMVSVRDDDAPKKLTLRARLSKRGHVAKAVFKLPPLHLNVITKNGQLKSFRFIPALGEAGFLISPLVESNYDFVQLFGARPGRQVERFWLTLDPDDAGYYQNQLEMKLETVPTLVRAPMSALELNPVVYPGFSAFPSEVQSNAFVAIEQYGSADVVIVHAEGVVEMPVSGDARHLEGRFGIMPVAYNTGDTDGVRFAVEFGSDDGTFRELYKRHLNPRAQPSDAGIHSFRVAMPTHGGGFIRLRTTNPPGSSASWDWSYWSGIRLR